MNLLQNMKKFIAYLLKLLHGITYMQQENESLRKIRNNIGLSACTDPTCRLPCLRKMFMIEAGDTYFVEGKWNVDKTECEMQIKVKDEQSH